MAVAVAVAVRHGLTGGTGRALLEAQIESDFTAISGQCSFLVELWVR